MIYTNENLFETSKTKNVISLMEGDILKRKIDDLFYSIESVKTNENEKNGSILFSFLGFNVSSKALKTMFYTDSTGKDFFVFKLKNESSNLLCLK